MIADIRWRYCYMGDAPQVAVNVGGSHSTVCQVLQVRFMYDGVLGEWVDVQMHSARIQPEKRA